MISHDATEAVLTTISEQKIDLMIIDYETMRSNKKLQTLLTCDVLAIIPHSEDYRILDRQNNTDVNGVTKDDKRNMVVLYDDGDNSDEILKATTWFASFFLHKQFDYYYLNHFLAYDLCLLQ